MPFWRKREDDERKSGERPEDWEKGDLFDDPFFDIRSDLFRDFDDQFRRMRAHMDAMMEKAASGELRQPGEGGPFVYGWSMRVGPDGVPHVQTFGNVRPSAIRGGKALPLSTAGGEGEVGAGGTEGAGGGASCSRDLLAAPGVREPLTDVCEGEKEITVIAEMPGIEKNDIELETGDDFLVIKVGKGPRKYYKELTFDAKVVEDSARAKYNNGVLEIKIEKAPAERKGTRVKVE